MSVISSNASEIDWGSLFSSFFTAFEATFFSAVFFFRLFFFFFSSGGISPKSVPSKCRVLGFFFLFGLDKNLVMLNLINQREAIIWGLSLYLKTIFGWDIHTRMRRNSKERTTYSRIRKKIPIMLKALSILPLLPKVYSYFYILPQNIFSFNSFVLFYY